MSFTAGQVFNYDYTGSAVSLSIPAGEYASLVLKLEVWGAQGGYRSGETRGGKGGYSVGVLTLGEAGATLYIRAGGAGNTGGTDGGFNGGGARSSYSGGGGASDIRIGQDSLYARVIVAGGGGSDGASDKTGMYGGGESGGTSSENYGSGGGGGTQTAGGAGGNSNDGAFGQGGKGTNRSSGYGGAGGGGWYGGGGAYPDGSGDDDRGGGGGSGYVYTSSTAGNYPSGCLLNSAYYLTNASTQAGNTSFTAPGGSAETGHSGNGYVRITVVSVEETVKIKPPANLQAYNITHNAVYLSWTAGELCTGYKVKRNNVQVSDQTGLFYADSGLSANTSYTYSVLGYGADGTETAAISVTIKTATAPADSVIRLRNLAPSSGWSYSGVTYADGIYTFAPEVTAMALASMPMPIAGHKYYGRAVQKAPAGLTFADHRFEWYAGDVANALIVFATLVGTDDEWVPDSDVLSLDTPVEGNWTIRNFIVNGSATTYRKELLIVDLTEAYGGGNEPDKAWCDANIPYFANYIDLAENPTTLEIIGVTKTAVILSWSAAAIEQSYRLYRDGVVVYDGTRLTYTDHGLAAGSAHTYTVTGYNAVHETLGITVGATTRTAIERITDRTAADASAGRRKGFYNALDLIRVGEAMAYLEERFADVGISVSVSPKLDWQLSDIPTHAQAHRYLTDIGVLRYKLTEFRETVSLPGSLTALTWASANDIEVILLDAEKLIRDIILSYRHYSGRTISGVNALP